MEKRLKIVSMPLTPYCLDTKYCYLIDAHSQLFVWLGKQSRNMIQTKGRLLAETINVRERRGEAKIHIEPESRESNTFWAIVTGSWTPPSLPKPGFDNRQDKSFSNDQEVLLKLKQQRQKLECVAPQVDVPKQGLKDFIPLDWELPKPILYDVQMGKGYLELPQVIILFLS